MNEVRPDGKVEMIVAHEDGKVVQRFKSPQEYVVFDPPNAIAVAEALTAAAFKADTGLKPVGDTLKASLVQKHRDVLIPRIALMLGSMREDRLKSNGQLATSIMDSVCNEVFT
jgi:hypothetical protein